MPEAEAHDIRTGRRYVLAAIALLVAVDLAVTLAYLVRIGPERIVPQITRLAILIGIGVAMLRGHGWARWLTVILLLLGIWVGLGPILRPGAFDRAHVARTLPLLAVYLSYGIVVRGLIYSESVREFFRVRYAERRGQRASSS